MKQTIAVLQFLKLVALQKYCHLREYILLLLLGKPFPHRFFGNVISTSAFITIANQSFPKTNCINYLIRQNNNYEKNESQKKQNDFLRCR